VFFSLIEPYSFQFCQNYLDKMEQNMTKFNNLVYFKREILALSVDGRTLDLITLSTRNGLLG